MSPFRNQRAGYPFPCRGTVAGPFFVCNRFSMAPQRHHIELDSGQVTAFVYWELRRNLRFSLTKKGPVMRAPRWLPPVERQKALRQFEEWVRKTLGSRTALRDRYTGKGRFGDGDTIEVMDHTFHLRIEQRTDRKQHRARILDDGTTILLEMRADTSAEALHDARIHLLSRLLAARFRDTLYQRLQELNEKHFRVPIKDFRLRYARTRWGSCAHSGNINLNTRLLLAPPQVRDYVMIHELAHRIHPNHSQAFWAEVARAMPDYRTWHQWLRTHGDTLDF